MSCIVGLPSTYLDEESIRLIRHPKVAGIILFTRNYTGNPEELKQFIANIKVHARNRGKENFMVVVDHEGGKVQRFRKGFTPIPSPQQINDVLSGNKNPIAAIFMAMHYGFIMAIELKHCGIDASLAPVADLDFGNIVISGLGRSFHHKPEIAIVLLRAFICGMHAAGMNETLKHFPGHGSNAGDSHLMCPVDFNMEQLDLQFQIFRGLLPLAGAIMPAHIIYPNIDPNNTAGSSSKWMQKILRNGLGFSGVIISDCLGMAGAPGETLVDKLLKTWAAGVTLALWCNESPIQMLEALNSEAIKKNRVQAVDVDRINKFAAGPSKAIQGISRKVLTRFALRKDVEAAKADAKFLDEKYPFLLQFTLFSEYVKAKPEKQAKEVNKLKI